MADVELKKAFTELKMKTTETATRIKAVDSQVTAGSASSTKVSNPRGVKLVLPMLTSIPKCIADYQ